MKLQFLCQAILQMTGLIYATIKYKAKDIDSIDNYTTEVMYSLPFNGKWYVANGGVTKNTSHSWEILSGIPKMNIVLYAILCQRV